MTLSLKYKQYCVSQDVRFRQHINLGLTLGSHFTYFCKIHILLDNCFLAVQNPLPLLITPWLPFVEWAFSYCILLKHGHVTQANPVWYSLPKTWILRANMARVYLFQPTVPKQPSLLQDYSCGLPLLFHTPPAGIEPAIWASAQLGIKPVTS